MTGLRIGVIGLLLLAALNPSLPWQRIKTVVLLDQSPSARDAVWKIAPQLEIPGAKYVAFASGAETVAASSARRLDLGDGTDLEAALKKAEALSPDQILLVSDGLFQTTGISPVPIFGLYQPSSANLSLTLVPPALPTKGETVEVRAVVESTTTTRGRLVLDGAGMQTRDLSIQPGKSSVGYRFRLDKPTTVRVTLETPEKKQSVEQTITPVDTTRVWVMGDAAVAGYLKAQGFAVQERQSLSLPIQAEVVVLGVGTGKLSGGELDALDTFLNQGGSLLWTATPSGLFFGGWERSSLADAIPVEPQEEPNGVGLVLVLDVSGSMDDENKLGLAVAGATELVRSARPQDFIGVVTFSDRVRWLFRPRAMTEQGRKEAESLLNSAGAGGGTIISGAYAQALDALNQLPMKSRQVLVLTDGLAQDANPAIFQVAQQVAPTIKTNTVALGSDADQNFLRQLALRGQGTFWDVPSPQDLPRFFLEQAQRNFKRNVLEGRFPVSIHLHPITQNLNPSPLTTVLPARVKPWAQSLLDSSQGSLLAIGESGRGRVAALSTDLSKSWRGWEGTGALLAELMRWLSQTPARPKVEASRTESGVKVTLEGQFSQPRLRWGGKELVFSPAGSLRFVADLPPEARGDAQVLEGDQTRLGLNLPVPAEWRIENGQENLKQLSQSSGGRLLTRSEDAKSLAGWKKLDLQPYLLALALLLFLLERFLGYRRMVRVALNSQRKRVL